MRKVWIRKREVILDDRWSSAVRWVQRSACGHAAAQTALFFKVANLKTFFIREAQQLTPRSVSPRNPGMQTHFVKLEHC